MYLALAIVATVDSDRPFRSFRVIKALKVAA